MANTDCLLGKIRNPKTGRCVKATGRIGHKLLQQDCPNGKIRNPKTNRCVKIDGKLGRKILYGGMNVNSISGLKLGLPFDGIVRKSCQNSWIQKHKIGSGGYGQVYIASIKDSDFNYVVKIQDSDKEFYNEVHFLNKLGGFDLFNFKLSQKNDFTLVNGF